MYKVSEDYFETNNLIHNPKYERIYKKLEYFLFKWMENSDFGNMSEVAMLDSMFTNTMTIPKLKEPKITINDEGYIIEPNNPHTSVGWRRKNEKVWNIYTKNELIKSTNEIEVILFKPGYEILVKQLKIVFKIYSTRKGILATELCPFSFFTYANKRYAPFFFGAYKCNSLSL